MTKALIGLDVGTVRTGVALAPAGMKLAAALTTISMDDSFMTALGNLAKEHEVAGFVVGYPRNQSGETTAQTGFVEGIAKQIAEHGYEVVFQDESTTSVLAEQNLAAHKKAYSKEDIDAESARIILQDYLEQYG